jgi:hypothetical protein
MKKYLPSPKEIEKRLSLFTFSEASETEGNIKEKGKRKK